MMPVHGIRETEIVEVLQSLLVIPELCLVAWARDGKLWECPMEDFFLHGIGKDNDDAWEIDLDLVEDQDEEAVQYYMNTIKTHFNKHFEEMEKD